MKRNLRFVLLAALSVLLSFTIVNGLVPIHRGSRVNAGVGPCYADWQYSDPVSPVTINFGAGSRASVGLSVFTIGSCNMESVITFCVSDATGICLATTTGFTCDSIPSAPLDTVSLSSIFTTTLSCGSSNVGSTFTVYATGTGFGCDTVAGCGIVRTHTTVAITFNALGVPFVTTSIRPSDYLVIVGATLYDQATLSGGTPSTGVTGFVDYTLYPNQNCAGTGTDAGHMHIGFLASVPPSNPVTITSTGYHSFNAAYKGDSLNIPVTSSCESFNVFPATPTITTKSFPAFLADWTKTNPYPTSLIDGSCVVYAGFIDCIGGAYGGPYGSNGVDYAELVPGGVSNWQISPNSYPTPVELQSCLAYAGFVYCIGGAGNNGLVNGDVYSAPLLRTGGVGTWKLVSFYPTAEASLSCVVDAGTVVCVGGGSTKADTASVYYAQLSSTGGISPWKQGMFYPTPITRQSCVAYLGNIYCVGGVDSNGNPFSRVYSISVSTIATTPWKLSPHPYPNAVGDHSCVTESGFIYCIGGASCCDNNGSHYITGVIDYTQISDTGDLSSWSFTSHYPLGSVYRESCVALSGVIYCVGGTADFYGDVADVYSVPLTKVVDIAILSGGYPSTGISGTVTYYLINNLDCSSGAWTVFGPYDVGPGNSLPAVPVIQTTTAPASIFADFRSGDPNNLSNSSPCEQLPVIHIAGADNTSAYTDSQGNIIIDAKDSGGVLLGRLILPPGATFPSNIVNGRIVTIGSTTQIEVSGISLPRDTNGDIIPKSILIQANPGVNSVCIVDGPSAIQPPDCSLTNINVDTVIVSCNGTPVGPLSPFPDPNTSRTYTCSTQTFSGRNYFLVTGLDYSFVETLTHRTTSTTISCDPTSVPVGGQTICSVTATDTDTGTPVTPTGTVFLAIDKLGSFSANGSCFLAGTGASASCSLSYPSASSSLGPQTISATYTGDISHFTSNGSTTVTVLPPVMTIATSTSLTADITGQLVITADRVVLDCNGHTIKGVTTVSATSSANSGITLDGRKGVVIKNCKVTNFYIGIQLVSSSFNLLIGNNATANSYGFWLSSSYFNALIGNTASMNVNDGFHLESSNANALAKNIANKNSGNGFSLLSSSSNILASNNSTSNIIYGFSLSSSNRNVLFANRAINNGYAGINLSSSSRNLILNNTANINGTYGFQINSASNNNQIISNDACLNRVADATQSATSTGNLFRRNRFCVTTGI